MKRPLLRPLMIGTFACLLCAAGGTALGALVLAPPVPDSLRAAPTLTSAPVESRDIDDLRNVPLAFITGKTTDITAPLSGKVTSLALEVGSVLESGHEITRLDGQALIALATSTPLYRPLSSGIKGDDVTALQEELARFGYSITVNGVVDWNTLWAAADLLDLKDATGGISTEIPINRIVWIPAPSVTVASLDISLGQFLDEKAPLLTVSDSSERAVLTLPEEALLGDRVLTLSTGSLPVPADGVITDTATLQAIKDSEQYKGFSVAFKDQSSSSEARFQVPWVLATPIHALVVPPSALFGLVGNQACIAHEGKAHTVTVLGSQLGQSYIMVDEPVTSVDLNVEGLTCQ